MSFIEIYLDKVFVDKFKQKAGSYNYSYYTNFRKFWNILRNYRLITNFSKNEWEYELRNENEFIKNIYSSGRNPEIEFDQDLQRDLRSITTKIYSSPFKLFFVESLSSTDLNHYGFENIRSDEFNSKWHLFYSERDDKVMQVTAKPDVPNPIKFDSWKKVDAFSHPFHSIIIFDLYILLNKENEKIENNLFQMLLEMINNNPNEGIIDLQIITQFKSASRNITETYDIIKQWLNLNFGEDRINFSIVVYNKDVFIRDFQSLSFRRIFTNYFEFSTDKGFNFFRNNGKPGKLQDIKFEFIFFGYNSDRVRTPLAELQMYNSKVANRPQIGSDPEHTNYYPNKQNKLLTFQV